MVYLWIYICLFSDSLLFYLEIKIFIENGSLQIGIKEIFYIVIVFIGNWLISINIRLHKLERIFMQQVDSKSALKGTMHEREHKE